MVEYIKKYLQVLKYDSQQILVDVNIKNESFEHGQEKALELYKAIETAESHGFTRTLECAIH